MGSASTETTPITEHEAGQVERANATTATPVVFVHGLWLLPSKMKGRGHALTIDSGWREVADTALAFIGRFV